jgi:hypothetical protein
MNKKGRPEFDPIPVKLPCTLALALSLHHLVAKGNQNVSLCVIMFRLCLPSFPGLMHA